MAVLRGIRHSDFDAVAELTNRFFPYVNATKNKVSRRIRDGSVYFVAEVRGLVAGFVDLRVYKRSAKIFGIAVDEGYQQGGLGGALLEKALEFVEERDMVGVSLRVRQENATAIRLYEKHGFAIRKAVGDYMRGNAYIMEKRFIRASHDRKQKI